MPISRIKTDGIQDDAITSAKIGDTNIAAADIADGAITDAKISSGITASKLTGDLPAISGANLTDVAVDGITSTANATAITINSDEEVLFGKTSVDQQTAGTVLYPSGQIYVTATSTQPMVITRKTNDGALALFYKDTNEVGRIAANGGSIIVGSGNTGLYFDDGSDRLIPIDPATTNGRDNAVNLGGSSERFKDLYLSGGVYLGGTASANKLDDYEEGTWTPSFSSQIGTISYGSRSGRYTKTGNLVTATFWIYWTSITGNGSYGVNLAGLPFTSVAQISSPRDVGGISGGGYEGIPIQSTNRHSPGGYVNGGSTTALPRFSGGGASEISMSGQYSTGGGYFYGTLSYFSEA